MPKTVIKSMSDSRNKGAAEHALLQLSAFSEANAIRLAQEPAESLDVNKNPTRGNIRLFPTMLQVFKDMHSMAVNHSNVYSICPTYNTLECVLLKSVHN